MVSGGSDQSCRTLGTHLEAQPSFGTALPRHESPIDPAPQPDPTNKRSSSLSLCSPLENGRRGYAHTPQDEPKAEMWCPARGRCWMKQPLPAPPKGPTPSPEVSQSLCFQDTAGGEACDSRSERGLMTSCCQPCPCAHSPLC